MPSNKTPAKKKSTKKSSRAVATISSSTAKGKNNSSAKGGDPSRLLHQLMPYILALVAVFILISYFVDATGFVGRFIRNVMFGFFSGGAWMIPFLLVNLAVFWKRDVAAGRTGYKITFSIICVSLLAVLINAFSRNGGVEGVATFNLISLFKLGCDVKGGGIIGGLLGNLLFAALGFVGTLIFSIALILLFGIFLFGMTPQMFAVYVITGIRDLRAGFSSRMSDSKAEREQMLADYEAERAARAAEREEQRAAAERERAMKRENKRRHVNDIIDDAEEDGGDFFDAEQDVERDAAAEADLPIDPSVFEVVNEVESDAPPFDIEAVSKESIKPLPLTGEQELEALENDEIDLSKIFVEPTAEKSSSDSIDVDPNGEEIVTSAEIDLMVEKSRLALEPIMTEVYGEDDPTEDTYMSVSKGQVKTEPIKVPDYIFPPISLLRFDTSGKNSDMSAEIQQTATKLVETLRSFNVKTKIINVSRGPTITRYELQPEVGTKVRSILNLVDDIALHLATSGVRIEAPIPGKEAVGIEVPNRSTATVYIRELLEENAFKTSQSKVTTTLGMDVAGAPVYLDVAKMPHLLIAGTTGSGKSVCINSLIISMLYKARPDEVKFIMIDPKKVELNVYNGIPHLLVPVVSDPKKAAGALHWAVTEMERRYELIEGAGVRNIKGYNQSVANDPDAEKLPLIVIIIDELADLMMMARDDVEEAICRIAQKARAAGMHLVIGTQRPSVDVVTGLIKANVPSRIAFTTANQVDSRTIIDTVGAEKLIGRGDMLYAPIGSLKPMRVQGCFVSDDEVEEVTTFIKNNYGTKEYDQSVMDTIEREAQLCGNKKSTVLGDGDEEANDGDPMLKPAIQLAVESGKISTSLIQRRLQLGYGRAAKLIDTMEQMGIVSAPQGQKPRDVLISKQEYMEMELRRGE